LVEKTPDGPHHIGIGAGAVDFDVSIVFARNEPEAADDRVVAHPANREVVALAIFEPVELALVFEAPIGPLPRQMHSITIEPARLGCPVTLVVVPEAEQLI